VHDLDALAASAVLVLVQQALRRSESRRSDFFAALPSLLPTLKILGGSDIVDSVADIVLRSDRWTL
jgi:hypothetical protein